MTAFFVTSDGEELTHEQMTQRLMHRVRELEDNQRLIKQQYLNLMEKIEAKLNS